MKPPAPSRNIAEWIVVSADPALSAHPALRQAIEELLGVQAEYLDKT